MLDEGTHSNGTKYRTVAYYNLEEGFLSILGAVVEGSISSSGEYVLEYKLPEEIRPSTELKFRNAAYARNNGLVSIKPDGTVTWACGGTSGAHDRVFTLWFASMVGQGGKWPAGTPAHYA